MDHHIRGFIARQDDLRKAAMSLPGARDDRPGIRTERVGGVGCAGVCSAGATD